MCVWGGGGHEISNFLDGVRPLPLPILTPLAVDGQQCFCTGTSIGHYLSKSISCYLYFSTCLIPGYEGG